MLTPIVLPNDSQRQEAQGPHQYILSFSLLRFPGSTQWSAYDHLRQGPGTVRSTSSAFSWMPNILFTAELQPAAAAAQLDKSTRAKELNAGRCRAGCDRVKVRLARRLSTTTAELVRAAFDGEAAVADLSNTGSSAGARQLPRLFRRNRSAPTSPRSRSKVFAESASGRGWSSFPGPV